MLTKNACDVLAVIATNNLMTKEAGWGRALRAAGKALMHGAKRGGKIIGGQAARNADDVAQGVKRGAQAVKQGVKQGANAVKQGAVNAAEEVYTNPKLTNATRATGRAAKAAGRGLVDAAKIAGPAAAGSAVANMLTDDED